MGRPRPPARFAAVLVVAGCSLAACGPANPAVPLGAGSHRSVAGTAVHASAPTGTRIGPPLAGFAVGGGVSPVNFLPGQAGQPTGPALVSLLRREGIRIVRLVAEAPAPQPHLYGELHDGGWKTVFTELATAHIDAVLLVGGEAGVDGVRAAGSWPPEPPSPGFPAPGQAVEPTSEWIANQGAILADIEAQCGGVPAALVGVEVANEPLLDAATLPMLRLDVAAVHEEVPGVPVTIAGWRTAADKPGERWNFNDPADTSLVAPFVDYVCVHLYVDGLPLGPTSGGRGTRASADPATYVPAARRFLAQVIARADGKPIFVGELGSLDGRPETIPFQPSGGSPAHQVAAVEATLEAMVADRAQGVTGGTVWLLEENAGPGYTCTPFELVCFGRAPMPALAVLGAAARRYG